MQKMSKMAIFIHLFLAVFRVLKLDGGKYSKIVKFTADALSCTYFQVSFI